MNCNQQQQQQQFHSFVVLTMVFIFLLYSFILLFFASIYFPPCWCVVDGSVIYHIAIHHGWFFCQLAYTQQRPQQLGVLTSIHFTCSFPLASLYHIYQSSPSHHQHHRPYWFHFGWVGGSSNAHCPLVNDQEDNDN